VTEQDDFARRLTTRLDQGLGQIDAATCHRLTSMRRQVLFSATPTPQGHQILAWVHRHARISLLLALALLFSGWWFTQNTPRAYSAETDILLLTGELPPHAYADKNFSQWLKSLAPF
jgi:hypothetical protein